MRPPRLVAAAALLAAVPSVAVRAAGEPPAAPAPAARAAPGPAPAAPPKLSGQAITEMLAREVDPLPPVAFQTPAGLKGKVAATGSPVVKAAQDREGVPFSIGAEAPVICTYLRSGEISIGAAKVVLERAWSTGAP